MTHDGVRRRAGALFIRCAKQATARLLPASGRISLLFFFRRVRWDEAKDRTEKSDGLVIQGSHQPYSTTHLDIGLRHVLVAIKGLLALPIQGWAWQDA